MCSPPSGLFKSKTHWQDLVKKYLTLPVTQHERLVRDIELEDMFKSYQAERRFSHVFKYRRELGDALKMLRISQRVIFDNVHSVDMLIPKIREHAEKVGVVFLDSQPARDNAKVPNQLPNSLSVESITDVFPLPQFSDIMEAVNQDDIPPAALAQLQRNIVVMQDEMNDYRKNCADKFYSFFATVAQAANDLDDGFAFYVDLYGHVDATIRYGFQFPT